MKSETKCYLKVIKGHNADVVKQNQFKAAQRKQNRVKNSLEDYEKFLPNPQTKAAKHKTATMSW